MTHRHRFATLSLSFALLTAAFTLAASAAPQTASHPATKAPATKPAATKPATGLLDGQSFTGELSARPAKDKNSKAAPAFATEKGELSFTLGQLHAAVVDGRGFTAAAYSANQDGKMVRFSATLASPTEGKMIWKGRVTGKELEAEVRWEKAGAAAQELHYKGNVKP